VPLEEDAAAFAALQAALLAELAPVGAVQIVLAQRVVSAAWRLARADEIEAGVLREARCRDGGLGLAAIRDGNGARALPTLPRYRGAALAESCAACACSRRARPRPARSRRRRVRRRRPRPNPLNPRRRRPPRARCRSDMIRGKNQTNPRPAAILANPGPPRHRCPSPSRSRHRRAPDRANPSRCSRACSAMSTSGCRPPSVEACGAFDDMPGLPKIAARPAPGAPCPTLTGRLGVAGSLAG
jgi:hypothetical protein